MVVNPFVIANSGPGFNIITGQDANLDRQLTERPSFAAPNAPCVLPIKCTRFGNFNLDPQPGETIIPRNFGRAPGLWVVNLRVGRTFGFINKGNAAAQARPAGQASATAGASGPARPAGGPGGPMVAGGGGGAGPVRAVGGPGPQGAGPGGAGAASEKRFTLNVSIYFQNLLNHVNFSTPVGNLSSPSFGESLGVTGVFGGGGSTGAGNRRIYAQVRLNF